jgi:NADH-ubiquinone oxidoreductase chain 6
MTLWLTVNLLITLRISLILVPGPFTLGLSILFTAILVALTTAILISSWLGFLIYLIYVGGILVIFSYFLALTPNQPTIFKLQIPTLLLTYLAFLISTYSTKLWGTFSNYTPYTSIIFENANLLTLLLAVLTLLLAIIIVAKTSIFSKGPLRAFISYV